MTGTAYPGDAVTGVPTYTATQGRTALAAAMGGATTARPLGGFTGVRPGTPSNIATATSTTWTVTPFAGYIDLESPGTTGGYYFSFQANETGTVTAAAVSARVDLLYVQINDSNTGDGSGLSPRVTLGYQAGVAGAGIPALSAARAFVIAQINVPASGGGSPTVTWVAPYTVAAGGILPGTAANYAAATYPGQYIDDPTLGPVRSNGTIWKPVNGRIGDVYVAAASPTTLGASMGDVTGATVTATSAGGRVRATAYFTIENAGSGATRTASFQLLCDGALIGEVSRTYTLLFVTPSYMQLSVTLTATSTPAAGSHTWKLQGLASSAAAVQVMQTTLQVQEF